MVSEYHSLVLLGIFVKTVGVFQMMIDSRQTHDSYSGVAWHAHLAGNDSDEDTQVYT